MNPEYGTLMNSWWGDPSEALIPALDGMLP